MFIKFNHGAKSMTLKEAQLKKNLTQFDLRIKSGIHQSKISLIENGFIRPSPEEIERLCKALMIEKDVLQFCEREIIPVGCAYECRSKRAY
jgi:transcriptional regulator with XRE-family HTH domain